MALWAIGRFDRQSSARACGAHRPLSPVKAALRRGRRSQVVLSLLSVLALVTGFLLATTVTTIFAPPAEAAIREAFTASFNDQDNGAIITTGNSQMSCPTAESGCAAARSGSTATSNNNFTMQFVDADNVATTTNSTSADLNIPAGATVRYALLTWGGRWVAGTGGVGPVGVRNQIQFQVPGGSYATITAGKTVSPTLASTDFQPYYSAADVTSLIQSAGSGTYWAANIAAATGSDRYAGWSLTVVYRDPSLPLRDLRIYQGFADLTSAAGNTSVDIPINGILTPATGPVNASVGVVTWEGDKGITGDGAKLGGVTLSDATHPATNFFNSAISDAGVNITARNPNYSNNLGVDVARISANGVLANNITSTTVQVNTVGDFYYPTQISTQIDLYTPAFNPISKSVNNLSGHDPARAGDSLEYQVTFTNTGEDFADNAVLRDALPPNVTYLPGTLSVLAGAGAGAKTDAAGDDIGEYVAASRLVRFRVGTGASATAGGTLAPGATVTVRFRVTVDSAASGTNLLNHAELDYRARTIGRDYTFIGNQVSTPVQPNADLSLTKVSEPTSAPAGSNVNYRLQVTNNGPNDAPGVTVVDTLPTGVEFVSSSPYACAPNGQVLTCSVGTVAQAATSQPLLITVRIPPNLPAGSVANTATVSSAISDDVPANNTATATTTITNLADVSLTKSGTPATVSAGNSVTYTLVASNAGPSTAAGTTVVDQLPSGLTVTSATSTTGNCSVAGLRVGCTIGDLSPGAQATITIVAQAAANLPAGTVTNRATISTSTPESNTANNVATADTTIAQAADLALTKTANTASVVAGEQVSFTIQVRNDGPSDASNIVLSDPIPTGLTNVGANTAQGSCTVTADAVTCSVGTLPAGASATVLVQGVVAASYSGATLVNTASVTSDTPDPAPANNSGSASIAVTTSADLSLAKTVTPSVIVFGQPVTYTLTVSNAGPSVAAATTVTDPLPAGFTFVSSASGCTAAGGTVTCLVGNVTPGTPVTVSFVANTPTQGPAGITNTATVQSSTPDPVSGNNSGSVSSAGQTDADLAITKTAGPMVAGNQVTYTITVVNNGPSAAAGVQVLDALPPGVTFVSDSLGACAVADGTAVACSLADLAPGASVALQLVGAIDPAQRGTSVNTATVSSAATDPSPGNNSASSTSQIAASADLGVVLTGPGTPVVAGTEAPFQLSIVNNGPSTADNVVVTLPIPPGLVPVAGTGGPQCTVENGTLICRLTEPLAPGAQISLTALVTPDNLPGTLSWTASVGSDTPDPNPDNDTSTATIDVITSADLALTKSTEPNPLVPGSPGTYILTLTNNGPSNADSPQITDTVPAGLTIGGPTSTIGSCSVTGQQVTCTATRLGVGRTMTVRIPVTLGAGLTGQVTNTASATSATNDPNPGNNTASVTTDVLPSSDIQVTKTVSGDPVLAGNTVVYTLTVVNAGPSDSQGVQLFDTLPEGLTILAGGVRAGADAECQNSNFAVDCSWLTLPAGQSRVVTVEARVLTRTAAGTVLTNTVNVTSNTADPNPDNNSASVSTTVQTAADIVVEKALQGTNVDAGDQATYVISVTNNGPSIALGVVLTDQLPQGTTFVSANPSLGTCSANDVLTCNLGDVPAARTVTITLVVRLAANMAGTVMTNSATAKSQPATGSPTPDPLPDNNTGTASTIVTARADLDLTKQNRTGSLVAGQDVEYQLTLTNNGPSDANQPTIVDPVPAGLTFVAAQASTDGACALVSKQLPGEPGQPNIVVNQVECHWDVLPVGSTVTAVITLHIPEQTAPGTTITNTANASSQAIDPTPATASVAGSVTASADLRTEKTLISGAPVAGGPVQWRVRVTNDGPSTARAVTLTDTVPSAVTFSGPPVSGQGTCTVNDQQIACAIGDLAPGAAAAVVISGTLAADYTADTITNSAVATSPTPDANSANNTANSISPVTNSADLIVTKSATPEQLVAGSPVTWTVTVTNPSGPSVARDLVLTDQLPVGVADVTAQTPGGTCEVADGRATCSVGSLAVGGTVTMTVRATVLSSYLGGSVANSASVTASTPDPDRTNNSATATSAVATSADLSIVKTGPSEVAAGESIRWTLQVTNNGPSDAGSVLVTDQVPAGVSGIGGTSSLGACSVANSTVTCLVGTLASGQSSTVTITGTVDADVAAGAITNTASVSSSVTDPTQTDNSATATTQVLQQADLSVTKRVDSTVVAGAQVRWLLEATNVGPSVATSVVIADPFPAGVTGMTATLGGQACSVTAAAVECAVDSMPVGTVQIVVTGQVSAGFAADTLTNTATVSSAVADPNADNNSASVSVPVVKSADLQVSKALTSGLPVAGEPMTFEVVVSNNGPSDAAQVTLTDALPAELLTPQVQATAGSCAIADGDLTCDLGTLADGDTVTVTVTGTLAPDFDGIITNTAQASSATPDPLPANNSSTAIGDPVSSADLAVTKTGPASITAGQQASWTVTVTNNGPSQAVDVLVSDVVSDGISDVSMTGAGADCTGTSCRIAALDPNAQVVLTVTGTVPSGFAGTQVTNSASVVSPTSDPNGGNNFAAVTSQVARESTLTVTKTASPSPLTPGGQAVYVITVTNTGPSDTPVHVVDVLPVGVTVVAPGVTATQGACASGASVDCALGVIAAGASATVTIPFTVAPTFTGQEISNTATASTPYGATVSGSTTDQVVPVADLNITKVGPDSIAAGETVTWTIEVVNNGPSMAQQVSLLDSLPNGLSDAVVTADAGDCTIAGGLIVTCTFGDLPPTTRPITIVVQARVDPDYADPTLVNTAIVNSPTPEPTGDNEGRTAQAQTQVTQVADVRTFKTATQLAALPGDQVSWTITVRNNGPSLAREVVLTDPVPAGLLAASLQPPAGLTCDAENRCVIGDLPPGAENDVVFTMTGTVDPNATNPVVTNTAQTTLSSAVTDPNPGNNEASATIPVTDQADVRLVKEVSAAVVRRGDQITYTLTVTNAGPGVARSLVVSDQMPAGITDPVVTAEGFTCTVADGQVSCTLESLLPGAERVLTVVAVVANDAAAGEVTNTASALAATNDINLDNNTGSAVATIQVDQVPPSSEPVTPPSSTPPSSTPPSSAPVTPPTSAPSSSAPTTATPTTIASTSTGVPTTQSPASTPMSPAGPPVCVINCEPPLVNTGVPAASMTWWALLLLGLGAGLSLVGRRRVRRH